MRKMFLGAVSAGVMMVSAGAAAADPAIWKASDDDSEIWMFGSVHLLSPDTQWRTDALDAIISNADFYYYETPTDAEAQAKIQALVQQYGLNGPGETLNDFLSAEQAALLERMAPTVGLTAAQLQPLKPWLAGLSIGISAIQKAGYDPQSGVEMILSGETPDAQERFFETAEEQIKVLAGGDAELQAASLQATLEQLEDDPDLFDDMVAAWEEGDTGELHALMVESMRDTDPAVYQALVVNRNRNWVKDIKTLMDGDEDALIIVGAGHLVGEEGVPAMLEAEGYKVERVQ